MKRPLSYVSKFALVLLLVLAVAALDHGTGTELRVAPFYFFPIVLAARWLGRAASLGVALLCTMFWVVSNALGGVHYSSGWIWVWNTAAEGVAFVFIATLVSRLGESLTKEHSSARSDNLTGLPNSRAFHEQATLLLELCRREKHSVAMAYIDLDNFKQVNDTQGHHRGDDVLRIAAQIMHESLRASDLVARIGGDEFAALLPNVSFETAREILERLCQSIETRMKAGGWEVTASIGAVVYPVVPGNLDELIRAADRLMYAVKSSGKNRVRVEPVQILNEGKRVDGPGVN